jgi:transmembrane sensor
MNSQPQQDSIANDQAALWAARLEGGSLSAADRAALDAWLAENPAHRARLSHYCQFSADLEIQLPALVEMGAVKMPERAKPARSSRTFARISLFTAAAAAIFVLGFWLARPRDAFENFAAPPGQRQAFTLADGSRVELDAHTTLQFANRGSERRAKLSGGEAFFVVSKNKARPFIVETPAGSVRVTGTSFDVRAAASALDVTVVEGSVQVNPGETTGAHESTTVGLEANDRLSANASGVVVQHKLTAEALDELLAWRQGIVYFNDEPLGSALARFSHYQGRKIEVSPAAAMLRVGGRHSLDDLESFLSGLEEPLGIRVDQTPDGVLHVSRRSE